MYNRADNTRFIDTKEEADLYHRDNPNYMTTTKITWEE